MKLTESIKSTLVGKGSFTDMGDQYPVLDKHGQSNIKGLFVVGDISGTPDLFTRPIWTMMAALMRYSRVVMGSAMYPTSVTMTIMST